jgi:hypothetical protein
MVCATDQCAVANVTLSGETVIPMATEGFAHTRPMLESATIKSARMLRGGSIGAWDTLRTLHC